MNFRDKNVDILLNAIKCNIKFGFKYEDYIIIMNVLEEICEIFK